MEWKVGFVALPHVRPLSNLSLQRTQAHNYNPNASGWPAATPPCLSPVEAPRASL